MEWGIFVVVMGLALMVELVLTNDDMGDGYAAETIPDYEPEYESVAINVATTNLTCAGK